MMIHFERMKFRYAFSELAASDTASDFDVGSCCLTDQNSAETGLELTEICGLLALLSLIAKVQRHFAFCSALSCFESSAAANSDWN